jgi:hypothetical protein
VTQATDAGRGPGFSISTEATRREFRLCGLALLNHFLSTHLVLSGHLRLHPVELLILIATTTGNVQRAMRTHGLPEPLRGSDSLPPELVVPMSRRAIARITGIPTETVRRHVDSMVERGILVSGPKGIRAPNRLDEPWTASAMLRLLESHVDCTERLMALQILSTPQAPMPPPAQPGKANPA